MFLFTVTSVSVLITSLSEVSEMALLEEELPGVSKGESLNVELAKRFSATRTCMQQELSFVLLQSSATNR